MKRRNHFAPNWRKRSIRGTIHWSMCGVRAAAKFTLIPLKPEVLPRSLQKTSKTWSPDGKWIGFDDREHYIIFDLQAGKRKRLFKHSSGVSWSPDSRFLTYTAPGGKMGGFLFWGIQCIEPYRVWVWRVEDG